MESPLGSFLFLPVSNNDTSANSSGWARFCNLVIPEREHQVQGRDLKRNKDSFIKEEIPTSDETKSIVNPVTSKSNKATRNRHVSAHFSDRVVDEGEDDGVECIGDEKTASAAAGKTTSDTDEKSSTNGTTNGNKLDLSVIKSTLEAIGVVAMMMKLGADGSLELG